MLQAQKILKTSPAFLSGRMTRKEHLGNLGLYVSNIKNAS